MSSAILNRHYTKPERTEEERRQVLAMIERANEGEPKAVKDVLAGLDDGSLPLTLKNTLPKGVEEQLLSQLFDPDDVFSLETYRRQLKTMREELAGPDPSPLEALLAERIALSWLQCYYADFMEQHQIGSKSTLARAEFWRKRQDAAHKRLLQAMKTLAQVRKMALPSIQINVGEKQVNVQQAG